MSALTKNERDGLDEVFRSIHTNTNKYRKIREILAFMMTVESGMIILKFLKVAKYGLKETKFSQFLLKFTKKKKNLSK